MKTLLLLKTLAAGTGRALILAGSLAVGGLVAVGGAPAEAAGDTEHAPAQDWSFNGLFGTWDQAAIQRGFQVYQESCSLCHGMRLMSYRNLEHVGFSEIEVKVLAGQFLVEDGPNEAGEMFERPALPSDRFIEPFPNEKAARVANNGAFPKDLSVMAKARAAGPDYIYALLTGYEEPHDDVEMGAGMYFNPYFPGHQIAMPEILFEGAVDYQDGTEATVEQIAWDVSNFLMWAAEPNLEDRKRMGIKVILFLIVFSGMMYAVKRRVWADAH